jgi:glutaconate CoA-transferase subunit B
VTITPERRGADRAAIEPSVSELEFDAILFSRMLTSRDRTLIGAGLGAARAGALLASLTHASGIRLVQGLAWLDVEAAEEFRVPAGGIDVRDASPSDGAVDNALIFDDQGRFPTFFIIGGLEIDRYGNTNLWGEPAVTGGWRRRGPGAIGTMTMSAISPRIVLYSRRHDPSVIVECCAVVSALGWGDGETRERLGFPHPGPEACVTPAGIFDFDGPRHQMRLRARRPGWSAARIAESTGFELHDLDDAPEITPPTANELSILRERVDVEGALRD